MNQCTKGLETAQPEENLIAVAATFTAELVLDSIQYWTSARELSAKVEFAPYNQVVQQLLDPASLLSSNRRGLNVVLLRLEDLRKYGNGASQSAATAGETEIEIEQNLRQLLGALKSAAAGGVTPYLFRICPPSPAIRAEFFSRMEELAQSELLGQGNIQLPAADGPTAIHPVGEYYDCDTDQLGHVPYTALYFAALGTWICRALSALTQPPYKVIVLDCDQTLWTGVCGEDGPMGIRLDPPRRALQEFMRAQHDAGMLLCICSKNNEEDVTQVFERRTDMPVARTHIAAWRINWQPKSDNLKALAAELQLGLDSFIFVDDNPVECADVAMNCPGVLVLQLPEDVSIVPAWLSQVWEFDHLRVTEEDRKRTVMYLQNSRRDQFRTTSSSLSEFLAGLEIRVEIAEMAPNQLGRVAQLTNRTNQFNFTTRRRSEADLQGLLSRENFNVLAITVSDRFGDYGLVGAVFFETASDALNIDTFLLSCRVLGKGVEHRILRHLGEVAVSRSLPFVNVPFVPTPKNKPAQAFFEGVGNQFLAKNAEGLVFHLPAEFALAVRLNPEAAVPPPMEFESKGELPPEVTVSSGRSRGPDVARLALASVDVNQILKAMESSRQWHSAVSRDFVEPRTQTQRQLAGMWQRLLRADRIGIRDNYFELGGDSLQAVRLFSQVRKLTGKQLPLATLFEAPTVESLACIIEQNGWRPRWQSLVPIKASGSKPPFYCVHGVGGNILEYQDLAKYLDEDQPFYGIQAVGLDGKQPNVTVEEMAVHYIEEVTALQPRGPYYLGGSSFGGLVAYEMARQLYAQGERVALLALFDTNAPGYRKLLPTSTAWERRVHRIRLRVSLHWGNLKATERGQRFQYIREKARRWKNQLIQGEVERAKRMHASVRFVMNRLFWTKDIRAVNRAGHWAAGDYVPKEYAGAATLFRATEQPRGIVPDRTLGWGPLVKGGLHIYDTPGHHGAIVREPRSKVLAAQFNESLRAAQSGKPPGSARESAEEFRARDGADSKGTRASAFPPNARFGASLPEV
jgi:FkbH-like protein